MDAHDPVCIRSTKLDLADPQIPRATPRDNADIADIAEFILRITEDIWERKNVDLIHDCYAEDGPIHTLGGEVIGAEAVVRNTVKTLAAFPDRKMHADGQTRTLILMMV